MEQLTAATTTTELCDRGDLWCSGCKCNHPVQAFGVKRSSKRGLREICKEAHAKAKAAYEKTERGRAVRAKAKAKYNRSEKGRAAQLRDVAKYRRSEKGRVFKANADAKARATLNERAWDIIGKTCAWSDLGGCSDLLCKDHIVPVIRRRSTGYTSVGSSLNCWIIANPIEAKKKLQCLCERHNNFKYDMSDDVARANWIARYPVDRQTKEVSAWTSTVN